MKNLNAINTNKILVVDRGYVFFDKNGIELMNPIEITFLGCAAPNLKGMIDQKNDIKNVYKIFKGRVKNIILISENLNIKNLNF
jgi:hypothetical protein